MPQAAFGKAVIALQYRCLYGLANTAELPLKSMGEREQVSLSAALSLRLICQVRSKVCVDRLEDVFLVVAAHLISLSRGFCACDTVYSVFVSLEAIILTSLILYLCFHHLFYPLSIICGRNSIT